MVENFVWTDFTLLIAIFGVLLLLMLRRNRWTMKKYPSSERMPGYVLIYADQKKGKGAEDFGKLLYSARYALQGKPDYVFRKRFGRAIVPVELKSGSIGADEMPHRGDLLQLVAYFLILEDVYQIKPRFGKLIYQDYMFVIRNTRALRRELQEVTKQMHEMLIYGVAKPNSSFVTCRHCICNGTVCPHAYMNNNGGKGNEPSGRKE